MKIIMGEIDMDDKFFEIEKKEKLFEREIDGFYYWNVFRRQIIFDITLTKNKTTLKKWKDKFSLKSRLINFKYLKRYIIKKEKNIDILLVADPRRILNKEGKYENIFIDNVNIFLSKYYKTLILEDPSYMAWMFAQEPHIVPTMSDNIVYTDFIDMKCPFYRFFYRIFKRKIYKKFLKEIDYIIDIVKREYGIDLTFRKKIYLYTLEIYYLMRKEYEKVIEKINPKIVLFNYKPTEVKALINLICKDKKIPTVNLQHGIISKDLSVEMQTDRDTLDVFPDYLFAFGEILANCPSKIYNENNIKYIGHPYLENKLKIQVERPSFMKEGYKYILIVSQEIIGKEFSEFTSALAKELKDYKEYKIIFKYHPAEYNREYKNLKEDNIIEIKTLEYDIYTLQKYSYIQIGAYSTGLYEGIMFELPTVVINNFYGADSTIETLKFMKKGFYAIKDAKELSNFIKLGKIEKPNKDDIQKIWKKDSYNNLLKEVREILKF